MRKRSNPGHTPDSGGFLYTAEIAESGFHPLTCIGDFKQVTGYPISKFLSGTFYTSGLVAPADREKVRRYRLESQAYMNPLEYTLTRKDGARIRVRESITILKAAKSSRTLGGIVSPLNGVQSDRTLTLGRSQLAELKKINDHLVEINQMKDEFLANTSHELRTPLNSIIGFLTLITEGFHESEEELRLFTRNALESSYHLLNVINDLLDISKIESGELQYLIEKVDVEEILREVHSSFEVPAARKGLDIEWISESSSQFAAADASRLKQVLINLTNNALKFTSKGGVKLSVRPNGPNLHFTVKDTGIGIPKNKQDKLFQKFVQIEGSSTRRYGGTGLGLVISKHLVEMMGGEIWIQSKGANAGTVVHFTVPRWTKEAE